MRAARASVTHPFTPVFDAASHTLILGSFPSPASRAVGFYYGHPRNRFWPVIAAVYGEAVPEGADERRRFVIERGLALWDVLASCAIAGAADASIAQAVPNDIHRLARASSIRRVFTTGNTAHSLYRRFAAASVGIDAVPLPSTSPANARASFDSLVRAYAVIRREAAS